MDPSCRAVMSRLSDYLDQDLRGAALLRVEAHLATCPLCRRTCASLAQTLRLVQVYRMTLLDKSRGLLN
jgi:predicted anti-sigma-YlaC factor YlaD